MAYCFKCGNKIEDDAVFCPMCGANQNEAAAPAPAPDPAYQAPNPGYQAPNPAYQTPNPGYQAPNPGYQAPNPGYQAPNPGYQAPNPGYQAPNPGYQAPAPGYAPYGYAVPKPPRMPRIEKSADKWFALPTARGLIANAFMLIAFTLSLLLSWMAIDFFRESSMCFPITSSSLLVEGGNASGMFTAAKILVIISVPVFAAYLFFSFFKTGKTVSGRFTPRAILAMVYLALILLALIFNFVFMVANEEVTVSAGYIFVFIFAVLAGLAELTDLPFIVFHC